MKGRMSIKSILGMALLIIFGFMFLNMSLAASTAKIVVETANIRQTPASSSTILKQVRQNEEVEVLEVQEDWIKVKSGTTTGYIKTSLLDLSSNENTNEENNVNNENNQIAKDETQKNEEVKGENNTNNIDSSTSEKEIGAYYAINDIDLKMVPLINAINIRKITKDEKVEVKKFSNNWAYVEIDNQNGWIYQDLLKSQAQLDAEIAEAKRIAEEEAEKARIAALMNAPVIKTVYVKVDSLYLRSEKSLESEPIKTFTKNTAISVIAQEDGWYQIRSEESIGYVSTQYVSDTKIETRTQSSSRSDVNRNYNPGNAVGGIVGIAQQYLGIPYRYGGTSPSTGFDCSGFTQYVYAQAGISLPRTAQDQARVGTRVSLSEAQPGDLVAYNGHVAIYVGNGTVIHSPRSGRTISYSSIDQAKSGGYQIRRIN